MTAMRRESSTREPARQRAARLLLGVFVLAAQLAPFAHLATHRNDHTHGPGAGPLGGSATPAGSTPGHDDLDHDHGGWFTRDEAGAPEGGPDETAPPASPEHGRASAAHFDLALLSGPPLLFLPAPAGTLAPPPDVVARWHHAPALSQPPVRGPPRPR